MITHLLTAGVFAPPHQTVTGTGIGSTAAMGTPKLRFKLAPTGRASTAALGAPALSVGSPPAAPGLEVLSQTFVNRAGAYPLDTTVVADLTGAGGVLIFVSTASGVTWVPTVTVGAMTATYLGKSPDGASTGTVWAYSLLTPPTGSAVNVRVLKADQYADQGVIAVLAMAGVQSYGFFDAKAGGSSITLQGTTTKSGGKIISYAHGHFTSGALTMGASTPTGVEQIAADTVNGDHPVKLAALDYGSAGVDVSINWTVPFNQVNGCCVEVEGVLSAPAVILNPPSIVKTSAVGTPVVSRGNDKIIAPAGIHSTVLGTLTVTKQTLAIWDAGHKHADLTLSGSPATVVEKTANASTHSIVLGTLPVVSGEKKYFEVTVNTLGATTAAALGFTQNQSVALNVQLGAFGSSGISWDATGNARQDNAGLASRLAWVAGDVLMFAIDMASGWVFFGKNGVWENAGNASQPVNFGNGDGKANNTTLTTSNPAYPAFDGHIVGDKVTANFGRSAFAYTPPTGYTALDSAPVASPQTVTVVGRASSAALGAPLVARGPITLSVTGIAPTSVLGEIAVTNGPAHIEPTGINSTASFGAPLIIFKVHTSGLAVGSVLGSPLVTGKNVLAPSGISPTSTPGLPTIQRGAVQVTVVGLPATSALGSPGVTTGVSLISAPGIAAASMVGSPIVARGPVTISVPGKASSAALGTPVVSTSQAIVAPAGIVPGSRLGTPKVSHVLKAAGIASGVAFGTAKIGHRVSTVGIGSQAVHGTHKIGHKFHVEGISSGVRFGAATLSTGTVTISPAGLPKTSTLGSPLVSSGGAMVAPNGIASTATLGIAALSTGPVTLRPVGIHGGGIGTPSIKQRIAAMGIDSTAAFGNLRIEVGAVSLQVEGIAPKTALGSFQVSRGGVSVAPVGIDPSSAAGQPTVIRQSILRVPGLPSGVAFGVSIIRTSGVQVEVPGIASGERFGLPYAYIGERPIGLPAYSFKVEGHVWEYRVGPAGPAFKVAGQVWKYRVDPSGPNGVFKVPTMQTFKFKVPRRAK